jgi:hypothetical protein
MGRETREALKYLEVTALLLLFIRSAGADELEARNLGTYEACETLATLDAASPAGWAALARITRHVLLVLEDRDDPKAVLVRELHRDILSHADQAAASARPQGE